MILKPIIGARCTRFTAIRSKQLPDKMYIPNRLRISYESRHVVTLPVIHAYIRVSDGLTIIISVEHNIFSK